MPDIRDLEKISQMLNEVGEKELEIGEIKEEDFIGREREQILLGEEPEGEEPAPPTAVGEPGVEEPVPEGGDEFLELLKDIEVGLAEEKELEEVLPVEGREVKEEELFEEEGEKTEEVRIEEPVVPPAGEEPIEEEALEEPGVLPAEEGPSEEIGVQPPSIEFAGEEPEGKAEEGGLDLPEDFEMEDLMLQEGPPEGLIEEERIEGEPLPSEPEGEEVEVREPSEEVPAEEAAQPAVEEFDLGEIETFEVPEEPAPEKQAEVDLGELEVSEKPEEPSLKAEELMAEEAAVPPVEEKIEEPEFPSIEEVGEEILEAEVPEIPGEAEELPEPVPGEIEEEVTPSEEKELELSDEDIVLIKTKLKQINPLLASHIQDVIMRGTLTVESMNEMLRLLISDAPEEELIQFIELMTGERIIPRRVVPAVIPAEKPPGVLGVLAQNLGPLVRVTGLFVIILAIISILFMLFIYRPIRAHRYYQEGIEYIQSERYDEAEKSFQRATGIYDRVREYDRFGWEYMVSGNYEAARKKFEAGISRDEELKNIDIRLHLAKYYNILEEFEEADLLYSEVALKKQGKYEYMKLKGINLIDWGKKEGVARLEEAYTLFNEEFSKNPRNSDPLFNILYIEILRKNGAGVESFHKMLSQRFPQDVDKQAYTELAFFYIAQEKFGQIRDILLNVFNKYPDYPQAHYAFAEYFKSINDSEMQEDFLLSTIASENMRELIYPWEKRDRELLSNAFNDLGVIYSRMETTGMAAESINYFKKAIEENSLNTEAYFNLAQVYFYREMNYDRARWYYEKARNMGYQSNDLSYNLGLLYFYDNSFSRALKQWSELAQVIPGNPYLSSAMGSAFLHMGKYNAALGEFLLLSEMYDRLVRSLGEIKPWSAYHKRILLESAAVHNNLGVAYQKLYEITENPEYHKNSLVALYKAGELADIVGTERGKIQYNIHYIIHPEVIRGDMAISDDLSHDYRFVVR